MGTEGKKTEEQTPAHRENSPMKAKISNKSMTLLLTRNRSLKNRVFLQSR